MKKRRSKEQLKAIFAKGYTPKNGRSVTLRIPEGSMEKYERLRGGNEILKYREERDGKLHLDVDASGRFGLSFPNFKSMREAINKEIHLKKIYR